jgi:hypothetical protein
MNTGIIPRRAQLHDAERCLDDGIFGGAHTATPATALGLLPLGSLAFLNTIIFNVPLRPLLASLTLRGDSQIFHNEPTASTAVFA